MALLDDLIRDVFPVPRAPKSFNRLLLKVKFAQNERAARRLITPDIRLAINLILINALIPFDKLELNSTGEHEKAFSVTDGNRFLIFLDADSPEEELIFNLCHELSHVFR